MNLLKHISSFFVVTVMLFSITETAISADSNHEGEYISEEKQESSVYPENGPELFGVHRQARSAVNLIRILPVPNAKNNDQGAWKLSLLAEIPIRRAVTVYLYYSRDLDQSLSIRELLFPFHHFL
jgi:hypothetical protein